MTGVSSVPLAKKQVLILGAGFPGWELAARLSDSVAYAVQVTVLGHPFKCPPAPFEGAFLLHHQFVERGIREAVRIRMTFPMAAPVPVTEEVSRMFLRALDERGIEYAPKQLVASLDVNAHKAQP